MRVSFKTFGCRLNRAETAQFEAEFGTAGCEIVPFGTEADIVIFNTCVVTATAEKECMRLIRSQRKKSPLALLAVAGCAVQTVAAERLCSLGADLVIPQSKKDTLVSIILRHMGIKSLKDSEFTPSQNLSRALLKVQDGCDFFCAYCIVPYTRGQPRSVPLDDCMKKAAAFITAGFSEIVVTGCNLACYCHGATRLPQLLAELASLPGLGRLRVGSIEAGTVEIEVAQLMADNDKLCRFMHLPAQSGDDFILSRMGRRYSSGMLAQNIRKIVELVPDIGLGTDIITGFPGETKESFGNTRAWLASQPLNNLHVFPYSERPGTPATDYEDMVPPAERKARARQLIALGNELKIAYANTRVGQRNDLLVERFDENGLAHGWSGEYLPCAVSGVQRDRLRKLVAFAPERADGGTLSGAAS